MPKRNVNRQDAHTATSWPFLPLLCLPTTCPHLPCPANAFVGLKDSHLEHTATPLPTLLYPPAHHLHLLLCLPLAVKTCLGAGYATQAPRLAGAIVGRQWWTKPTGVDLNHWQLWTHRTRARCPVPRRLYPAHCHTHTHTHTPFALRGWYGVGRDEGRNAMPPSSLPLYLPANASAARHQTLQRQLFALPETTRYW